MARNTRNSNSMLATPYLCLAFDSVTWSRITHHASRTDDDTNNEGNKDAADEAEDDNPTDNIENATRSTAASSSLPPARGHRIPPIIAVPHARWDARLDMSPAEVSEGIPMPKPTQKQRKKEQHCELCWLKCETMHEAPGNLKGIALRCTRQSSPIHVDFIFATHPAVASTGWAYGSLIPNLCLNCATIL
ncbi:hypothetical protein K438DRAFT_2030177 [Mycena galopus ATCC 62051]|nr:hypothetical protein K438DRAFT_2030177 [Mycena galopus ATCC 62051]